VRGKITLAGLFAGAALCGMLGACSQPNPEEERRARLEEMLNDSTLLRQLASYDQRERSAGIGRVRALGREQGTQLVLYLLQEPTIDDARLDVVLARILADWQDERAIGYLLQHMRGPDDGAVRIASEGLLVFGDHPRVADALAEMLESPVRRDRFNAASVLSQIESPRVADLLAEAFDDEIDKEIRALLLLGVIDNRGDTRIDVLINALVDPEEAIRREAWAALSRYRSLPEVPYDPHGPLEDRSRCVATLKLWRKGTR